MLNFVQAYYNLILFKSEIFRSSGSIYFHFAYPPAFQIPQNPFSLKYIMPIHSMNTMDDNQFRQLLDEFNFSWAGYRKVRKGVKKRISRHMQELNCPNMRVYLDLVNKSVALRQECEKRMTVSISRFFRDRQLWHDLEAEILPGLIKSEKTILRVWSAGCARGEEVYSFKILWERMQEKYVLLPEIKFAATDMHPDYIPRPGPGYIQRAV